MPRPTAPTPHWQILTCGHCGHQVTATYAIDRIILMCHHFKDNPNTHGVPNFDNKTWSTRKVYDNV